MNEIEKTKLINKIREIIEDNFPYESVYTEGGYGGDVVRGKWEEYAATEIFEKIIEPNETRS